MYRLLDSLHDDGSIAFDVEYLSFSLCWLLHHLLSQQHPDQQPEPNNENPDETRISYSLMCCINSITGKRTIFDFDA